MRTSNLLLLALASALAALSSQAMGTTVFFSDDFESYGNTAEMDLVWSNGGSATLDTSLGNSGNSLSHPGTAASFSGGNTNSYSFSPITISPSQVLTYSADIYDDGASANKRVSAGLRAAAGANLIEMGMYNAPSHYAHRTILFSAPNGGANWVAFDNIVDDGGTPIENSPVVGWHRYSVDITTTSATFILDLNSDGNINATAVVAIDVPADAFDIIRLGGPSDLGSGGGGANFDNVSLVLTRIPEPATCLLAGLAAISMCSIRQRTSN